jgi:hypothetical protein
MLVLPNFSVAEKNTAGIYIGWGMSGSHHHYSQPSIRGPIDLVRHVAMQININVLL